MCTRKIAKKSQVPKIHAEKGEVKKKFYELWGFAVDSWVQLGRWKENFLAAEGFLDLRGPAGRGSTGKLRAPGRPLDDAGGQAKGADAWVRASRRRRSAIRGLALEAASSGRRASQKPVDPLPAGPDGFRSTRESHARPMRRLRRRGFARPSRGRHRCANLLLPVAAIS